MKNSFRRDGFTKVDSDHIDAVQYDSMEHRMAVKFKNGAVYHVHSMPLTAFQDFMDSPSQGSHYHEHIKNNYHVERVK